MGIHERLQATGGTAATAATGRDVVSALADDFGQGNVEASTEKSWFGNDMEMTWIPLVWRCNLLCIYIYI